MFLQKLKNIFVSVQNNDIFGAEKYAIELRNTIYSMQKGGNHEFNSKLKADLDPIVESLGIQKKYVKLILDILNFLIDYVEKLKIVDVEKLSGILKEMRNILQRRLDKEMS
jgi:hypothetical protein